MANGVTLGKAYLQIIPSMEGVPGEIEEAMGDAGRSGASSFGSAFSTGLKAVGGAAVAAVGVASAGVAKLTSEATNAFADYEQLAGGVETLFGEDAAKTVIANANEAFHNAGLSANDYMETVTSFSAALINSLEGDTATAANMAEMAITDMADNANKMGTPIESLQTAYAGFAKQNFTMLDNLKLGYGGTKEEMERLLRDAEEMEGYIEGSFDLNNFADVVEAINIVQSNMGIAGATADEADKTISGSLAAMRSAWENLTAGFANPDADLGQLITNMVTTGKTALNNLMPTIVNALEGITSALPQIVPIISEELPRLIQMFLPPLIQAVQALLSALGQALPEILGVLIDVLPSLFDTIISTILEMLPLIIDLGLQLILALTNGIIDALPELIPAVVDVIFTIVDKLTEPDMLVQLIDAALQLIIALASGLIDALPRLIEKAPEIVKNLLEAVIKAAPLILEAGAELLFKLIEGILLVVGQLVTTGAELVESVKDGFFEKVEAAKDWGKDLIQNFIDGIKAKWENLKSTVTDLASTIKSLLGFSEPESGPLSNFHTYAPDMMNLFAEGIRNNIGVVEGALGTMATAIQSDFTTDYTLSGVADPNERLYGLMGGEMAMAGGDMVIPIYIGQEKLDTIILNAQQRRNLVSGGR